MADYNYYVMCIFIMYDFLLMDFVFRHSILWFIWVQGGISAYQSCALKTEVSACSYSWFSALTGASSVTDPNIKERQFDGLCYVSPDNIKLSMTLLLILWHT